MAMSLAGKAAIVTGAGGGINLEFARKLLEAGTNVLIADIVLTPDADKVLEQYKENPKAVYQKTDVSSWAELELMFRTAIEHFGQVDIVCPGAGVFEPPWSSFWFPPGTPASKDDPAGDRFKLLDINLTHPIRTAQLAVSHFLGSTPPPGPSNPKRIIFIASIAGEIAFLATPLYHASKWGIMGFIRSLSDLDAAFGIKVGGVAPGIVKTRLWTDHEDKMFVVTDPATGKEQESWIYPDEVADAMIALTRDTEVDDGKGNKIPLVSGTVLEVAHGALRDVPMLGNTGPPFGSPGMIIANMGGAVEMLTGQVIKPGWGVAHP